MLWDNERHLPKELLILREVKDTLNQLWPLIDVAQDEIKNYGAVKYPTKANIERLFLEFSLHMDNDE